MGDYRHGSMDISYHEKVYARFLKFALWVCIVSILVLIFLAVFNS
ncbi:MAG: aa3-type cytochrome c oxidase subunit IV [Albidovulum sp.]|nr:aa3-type cytochrome c oxidase subunit IV [Albidovulum sp.]